MCTLTWTREAEGYFVAFSRDERRTRAPGIGPRSFERGGVRAIAPFDGEAGGTWIAVNELGLTLALLNGERFRGAESESAERDFATRGELVLHACDASGHDEVIARLASLELARFRPFEIVAFDARGAACAAAWDGRELRSRDLSDVDRPLVSSSFDDAGARAQRKRTFELQAGALASARELELFHASHEPSRGAYSPCMHRDDAHTVSFTRVRVDARRVEFAYQPQSPCAGKLALRLELPRRVAARS
jgi:hypothetical protein